MKSYFGRIGSILRHPANRAHPIYAVARAGYWAMRRRISTTPRIVKAYGDRRIKLYPKTHSWSNFACYGEDFDFEICRFLGKFLRKGDVFLDIGANVGVMSVLASSHIGPDGRIIAVEPIPTNFARLQENFALNQMSTAEAVFAALGVEAGEIEMSATDAVSHVSTVQNAADAVRVPVKSMDELIQCKATICKIDVEGYELEVLRGAKTTIARGLLPVMVLEINGSSRRYGRDDSELKQFLDTAGYRLGNYDVESNRIDWNCTPWGDVIAANEEGRRLLSERLGTE
ncbi:MAG: FkbM family methyltransferase [Pirellulales bacterium]